MHHATTQANPRGRRDGRILALLLCDRAIRLVIVAAVCALVACPPGQLTNVPTRVLRTKRPEPPPETAEECLATAERLGVEGASQRDLEEALRFLERAEQLAGGNADLWIKQLRVVFLIASPIQRMRNKVAPWIAKGQALSCRVKGTVPDRVEGHYYEAVFLGFEAMNYKLRALDVLPRIVEAGRRAIEIDEGYDDAGGLVLMGSVLLYAPAWPHGVGDPEEGIELLRRAVTVSSYPVNRIILAKGLIEQGEIVEACEQLDKALLAPQVGRWALTSDRHRPEAWMLWNSYRCYR